MSKIETSVIIFVVLGIMFGIVALVVTVERENNRSYLECATLAYIAAEDFPEHKELLEWCFEKFEPSLPINEVEKDG